MKKPFLLPALFLVLLSTGQGQVTTLSKVLELKIPREGGANAASVVWHPLQKKYYASMAGNPQFCIGVYDGGGKLLSDVSQQALFDVRGLWYNPESKTLQMNGYKDYGWAEYMLDAKGMPVDVGTLHQDMNQPDEQCAGAFDPVEQAVYFLNASGNLDKYRFADAGFQRTIELHLGASTEGAPSDNSGVINQYNTSTVVYTGIKNAEIGLLNYDHLEIELYDLATGYLTRKFALPPDTKIPDARWLNFAFTNGIYWLFDTDQRIWMGFK